MSEAAAGAPSTTTSSAPAPSGAPSTGASHGATTETVNPGSWMAGFNDDLKGYVSNKGFKGPAELADAYRNFEKLQGVPQDRVLKLPDKFYDDKGSLTPEGKGVFERIGMPKDAKEYGLDKLLPKEGGDAKLMEKFSQVFHEAGVPKAAAEKIVQNWNEYQGQAVAAMKEQAAQKFKDQSASLQKDWGAAYDQNIQVAKEGFRRMGHDAQTVDALSSVLGHDKTMKLYHQLGSAVSESTFITGQQSPRVLEPSSAVSKINEYKQDRDFMKKVASGDVQAKEVWTKLHQQAYPGTKSFR